MLVYIKAKTETPIWQCQFEKIIKSILFSIWFVRINRFLQLQWPGNMQSLGKNVFYVSMCLLWFTRWVYKIVNKTKLPENCITYRLYLGEMPSTFLVPYSLDIRTHRSHVLAKILFAMSNSPNHRIVSPV